jgi:uncharacterized RDD family membrane protein YckC
MKTTRLRNGLLVISLVGLVETSALAQAEQAVARVAQVAPLADAAQPAQVDAQAPESPFGRRLTHPAVRIGSDYTLMPGDSVDEVVVIAGTAIVEGHVEGDLVVIFGSVRLASTAVVDGDFVVIGGNATIEPRATVGKDLVVVAGSLAAPSEFRPGGEQTVIGSLAVGGGLRALVPWVMNGLLWGRLIVPSLPWMWTVIGLFFAVYLALNVFFDRPVHACAEKLVERPLSAFMVGLLVLLLLGPVSVLLAVSVVGIAVIPFLLCAVFVAGLLGKVGVLRAIGAAILHQEDANNRLQSARSFALGFAAISLIYMVPILGIMGWATLGVFGLGASAMACAAGLRRENPRPAAPIVVPPTPAPPVTSASATGADDAPAASEGVPGAPAMSTTDLLLLPRASFLNRLGAFALDLLLVLLTYGLLGIHDDGPGRFFLLLLAYRVVFWTWKGTTVGGIISQLRVVRTDGRPLRFADSLVRGFSSVFSFAVLGLGCLWILRDPERQAWHDRIAGTYVVKVPRNWPLP